MGQRHDPASPFSVHGRLDAWNFWYGICGKHLQGGTSITVEGRKVSNPYYYGDEDGEMIVRFGRFMRDMCYEESPFLPSGDERMAICKAACAWQAPPLPMRVLMLGGQRECESLLLTLDEDGKHNLCIIPNYIEGHITQIAFQLNSPEEVRQGRYAKTTNGKGHRAPARMFGQRTRLHVRDE